MSRKLLSFLAILLVGASFTPAAVADDTVGALFFDLNAPGASLDILNITGVNSGFGLSPDTHPITSEVDLTGLSLLVTFKDGTSSTFGSSYFALSSDAISFDGTGESSFIASRNPAISALLTGDFVESTITLDDGSTVNINSAFSTTLSDAAGLSAGEFALIVATPGSGGGPGVTPEPESLLMVGTGLTALAGFRRRFLAEKARKIAGGLFGAVAVVGLLAASTGARAQTIHLATAASPSTGLAGFNSSTVTGSGFPSGAISPSATTVTFAATCGGAAVATVNPNSVTPFLGTSDHVGFGIPSSLAAGNYFLSVAGHNVANVAFASVNCSAITVTATTTTLAACVPTSSLAVTVGANVNAYVPFGYWSGSSSGIEEVPLEGSAVAHNFATSGIVNSCAANSVTGEVVCTENTANVDLINGTTLTTITSGSNTFTGFSGGSCENCGVGINASNNTAVIGMGLSGSPSGSGVQFLNLSNNTFNTPIPLSSQVSEDVSIDSGRNLILSPSEGGVYDLLQIGAGNTVTEFGNSIGGTLDSAAEDCTTGIALASNEFSDNIYITDLTQAAFTPGSPGTWTAPGQFFNLNDGGYSAGTCGISSAPGSGHLAVVTGEFGGSAYAALQLPATSGSGTPTLADYAYVAAMPNTPDGNGFSAGFDPHTVTAYTSPNSGKGFAVFADYESGTPQFLGVVDLACVLALPRTAGTHNVIGNATSCTRYVAIP